MITVTQTKDFLSSRPLPRYKNLGSFVSAESAERALGWYFVRTCCSIAKF